MSILIARDGFSFYVSNGSSEKQEYSGEVEFDKVLAPEEILQRIELAIQNEKIDLETVEKISLIYANNLYCFVPEELFDENHLSDYLKFNAKILTTDFLAHDLLDNGKYVNVFVPYANINNYFFERFGTFDYRHSASLLVENILKISQSEEIMYIHVFWQHFDLVMAKQGNLLLCNSFFFETPEDFVYYILFVAEQLKLDPEKFLLKLSGNISETSESYMLLRDYVRNCSFFNNANEKRSENSQNNFLLRSLACE